MKLILNPSSAALLLLCVAYVANALPQPKDRQDDSKAFDDRAKIYVSDGDNLQYVIDHANAGSRIFVGSGDYEGPIVVRTDRISLTGHDARIYPTKGEVYKNECSGFAGNDSAGLNYEAGICVTGQGITFDGFQDHKKITHVTKPVEDVSVSGFEIVGFTGPNIAVIGAHNTFVGGNVLRNSLTYGCITAGSTNSRITGNKVTSEELNFIGICMDDKGPAEVTRNDISGYRVGLCLQTSGSKVEENKVSDCCYGAFLDPKIERVDIKRNQITAMNPACPTDIGASGLFIFGGMNSKIEHNKISGMKNADKTGAGIIIFETPDLIATGNEIKGNELKDNDVDIFNGSQQGGNSFDNNDCSTSVPPNLCKG